MSYMTKGFLLYEEMGEYLVIYQESVLINDLAAKPFNIFVRCESKLQIVFVLRPLEIS
jgi:hypothetical protein